MSCMIVRLSLALAPLWLRACASVGEWVRRTAGIGTMIAGMGTMILRHMLDSFRRSMSCRGVVVRLPGDLFRRSAAGRH